MDFIENEGFVEEAKQSKFEIIFEILISVLRSDSHK